jgi:peroxiredoxin-like protein
MAEKTHRKSFEFHSQLKWLAERKGVLEFGDGKSSLEVATPVEFRGHPGIITPEDMLLGAASACTMTTFLSLAERQKLSFTSYRDETWGVISHDGEAYRYTEGKIRVFLTIEKEEDRARAEALIEKSHKFCFISNSLRFPIEVTAQIEVSGE